MIYPAAIVCCDRCDNEIMVDNPNPDDTDEVYEWLDKWASGWAVDEDGDDVCPECWEKWKAKQG